MFPAIIKSLRKAKKLTQIQLAAAIGVSPGMWEIGRLEKVCPVTQR